MSIPVHSHDSRLDHGNIRNSRRQEIENSKLKQEIWQDKKFPPYPPNAYDELAMLAMSSTDKYLPSPTW